MKILITGGTGYLGSHLVKYLNKNRDDILNNNICSHYNVGGPEEELNIVVYSKDWQRQLKLKTEINHNPNVKFILGDICRDTLDIAMEGVDYVIHAAAVKEINFCENNPTEALQVNTLGSQNVIRCAKKHKVKGCMLISTDKAFYPKNTYGMTKYISEKLFLEAGYTVLRYGNVFGSSGSVIDVWNYMLNNNRKLKITNIKATRFVVSINEAIYLILSNIYNTGLIIPDNLKAFRMKDLLKAFCSKNGIEVDYELIGLRSYEKKHESLDVDKTSKNAPRLTNDELIELLDKC